MGLDFPVVPGVCRENEYQGLILGIRRWSLGVFGVILLLRLIFILYDVFPPFRAREMCS